MNGSREAFITAFEEMVKEDKRCMLISADSMLAARAAAVAKEYPDNFVEGGIAEQCAVDVAAGMAASGAVPFVETYAGFLTMRACEQIRTFVAYSGLNVKMIGSTRHAGRRTRGVSHQFYEDIAILRSMPGVTSYAPPTRARCTRRQRW
jgi:transketolase